MTKKFFIHTDLIKRLSVLVLILLFISPLISLITLLLGMAFFFLFRRKRSDKRKLRSTDDSILLAPISGKTSMKSSGGKTRVTIKISFLKGYGISMPFNGDVVGHIEKIEKIKFLKFLPLKKSKTIIVLKSRVFGEVKFAILRTNFIFKPVVWVRSGDKGVVGAYVGFLPFGGKIVVEMKNSVSILLKNSEKVVALNSLIASNGIKDDR